ncbi:MAG TPA: hypothetical protein P5286_05580 [Treponemataceae bacterium]|nr:hypothetical protein [Treponemataceae bacterium]
MKRGIALVLTFVLVTGFLPAQTTTTNDSGTEPVPYEKDEFPSWQSDIRRAEIIAFGSLPFVTFMTSLTYDIYRYIDHDQQDEYLPWPMKEKEIAEPLSEDDQKKILLISVGVAIGVALFDYGFRAIRRHIRQSRQERRNREAQPVIIIEEIDDAVPAVPEEL